MTYMPQDFRGTLIRQQRERSERNRQAVVDALISSGRSIRDRYALLWQQQMERYNVLFPWTNSLSTCNTCTSGLEHKKNLCPHESFITFRRSQLAQLGSATGVYKTLVKYLVGVPQVCHALAFLGYWVVFWLIWDDPIITVNTQCIF